MGVFTATMLGYLADLEGRVSMAVFFCLTGYSSRRGPRNSDFGTKLTVMLWKFHLHPEAKLK